jgi:hypothetical protein
MRNTTTIVAMFVLLTACATAPPPSTDWSGMAGANPGFEGAGANATARSTGGGATVNVAFREMAGMSGTVRPWHVHFGTCGNDQGIVGDASAYPAIRPGSDGTATVSASLSVPLDPNKSYFVNIHKSPTELSTIVACGALSTTTTP